MNTVINFKTDAKIKKQAQKLAEDLGLSLSGVINSYLRQFVQTQTVFVSKKYDEPSDLLLEAVRESRAERKAGKHYSFKNNTEALEFIDKIIAEKK